MRHQNFTTALTTAVCLLTCTIAAAAASSVSAEQSVRPQTAVMSAAAETTVTLPHDDGGSRPWGSGSMEYEMPVPTTGFRTDLDMMQLHVTPPEKTVYQIGEALDLTGARLYGSTYRFSGELLTDHPELVDASDFDNTKSGMYIISVRHNDEIASFSVEVADGAPVTTTAVTEMTYISYPSHTFDGDVTGHCLEGRITLEKAPDKLVYQIGEPLDLTGALISMEYAFENEPLTDCMRWVDASEYDCSKPGEYTIYIINVQNTQEFRVQVVGSETEEPTTCTAPLKIYDASFRMDALPKKTIYFVGEELNLSGGVFSGIAHTYQGESDTPGGLSESSWEHIPLEEWGWVDTEAFDNSKPGTYPIYADVFEFGKAEFEVKVIPALTAQSGDLNGDSKRTISDAILMARICAEDTSVTVSDACKAHGDLDGIGGMNTDDLTVLLYLLSGKL